MPFARYQSPLTTSGSSYFNGWVPITSIYSSPSDSRLHHSYSTSSPKPCIGSSSSYTHSHLHTTLTTSSLSAVTTPLYLAWSANTLDSKKSYLNPSTEQ